MARVLPAGLMDETLERVQARVRLSDEDLAKMFSTFAKNDQDNSGALSVDEFYRMFNEERNPFGNALFEMVQADGDANTINFSEFAMIITTYALFSELDILQFCFNVVDTDKSGFVDLDELRKLTGWLHRTAPSNISTAIERGAQKYDQGDGLINFESFRRIHREFPYLLHPAYRLQASFMAEVMGNAWWLKKKRELGLIKEDPYEPTVFDACFAKLPSLSVSDSDEATDRAAMLKPGPELRQRFRTIEANRVYSESEEQLRRARMRVQRAKKREKNAAMEAFLRERAQKRQARALSFALSTNPADAKGPRKLGAMKRTSHTLLQIGHEPSPIHSVFGGR